MNAQVVQVTAQEDTPVEEPKPIIPELEDFEEEEIDDIFDRLQGT